MSLKLFTEEEVTALAASRYVELVSARSVHFTEEFKRKYRAARNGGARPEAALHELGIDAEVLGKRRVSSMDGRILTPQKRKPAKPSAAKQENARLTKLEHELAYARQELAFLKKLYQASQEERKK